MVHWYLKLRDGDKMKRVFLCLICVFMIASQMVFANDYEELKKPEYYSFSDDFKRESEQVDITKTGTGVKLDDNWASKSTGSMDGDGTTGITTFGFDGDNLVMCLYKQDTYPKVSANQAKKMAGINWTADHSKLSSSFVLKTTVKKSIGHNMWGVRFMQHNNEENYYMLFFGGMYSYQLTTNQHLAWGLYKVQNGNVTILKEQLDSTYIGTSTDAKLTLKYNNGKISFNLEYDGNESFYSGEYTDTANPYVLSGNDSTIQLVESNATSGTNPVYFREFSITNDIPYLTSGEPDNVLYYSPENTVSNNIIDFKKPVIIRKILYSGEAQNTDILVSSDKNAWYKLTDTEGFTEGKFINSVTDSAFRYVKAEGIANDLVVLTETEEITKAYSDEPIRLYPRLGGVDYFSDLDAVLSTDNENIVKISGNTVKGSGIGSAVITALKNSNSITVPVCYTDKIYRYSDDFSSYGTVNYSGSGVEFNKSWRSKTAIEGKMGYSDDATFGYNNDRIFVQARGLAAGDSYSRYPTWADTVPAVVWNENHDSMDKNHIIKMKIRKTSGVETAGVRFMVHNNGKSYYALLFPGMYAYGGVSSTDAGTSSWELVKCDGGQITLLGRLVRENQTADNVGGYLGFGEGELVLSYVDGTIEWNMNVTYNGQEFSWSDSYKDETPFEIQGADMGVWLMSGLYSGTDTTRGVYFDNISIASYVPYVTVDEPEMIVYKEIDANYSDGIYTLTEDKHIRRILSDGDADIFLSQDGEDWLFFKTVNQGSVLNNVYPEKFRYIKCVGEANITILGEIENNTVELLPNKTLQIYPYVDGQEYQDAEITEPLKCVEITGTTIKGISPVGNTEISLKCGDKEEKLKLSVGLITLDCDLSFVENNINLKLDSEYLTGASSVVVVAFFNEDHSIKDFMTFDATFENGTETVSVTNLLEENAYARVLVWTDLEKQVCLTKAITLK